jgi:hypothetical protein
VRRTHEQEPEDVKAKPPAPAPRPRVHANLLALQRSAGNRAVSSILAREPDKTSPPTGATAAPRVNYVFLMGSGDTFYTAAKAFLEPKYGAKAMVQASTLAGILEHVKTEGKPVGELLIVSHANEEGNLGFSLDAADAAADAKKADGKPRVQFDELKKANEEGRMPGTEVTGADGTTTVKLIDAQTKVIIKGCNIGRSKLMLNELDKAFGGDTTVTAPTHAQEYRTGPLAENLGDYFWESPGIAAGKGLAHAGVGGVPDPAGAAETTDQIINHMKGKYPFVQDKQWPGIQKQLKKKEENYEFKGWEYDPDPDKVFVLAGLDKQWKGAKVTKQRKEKGEQYEYTFHGESETDIYDEVIELPKPVPRAELIKMAETFISRPDAYGWGIIDTPVVPPGGSVALPRPVLRVQRTQWTAKGSTLEAGAGNAYHPADSDPAYYQSSDYAPAKSP